MGRVLLHLELLLVLLLLVLVLVVVEVVEVVLVQVVVLALLLIAQEEQRCSDDVTLVLEAHLAHVEVHGPRAPSLRRRPLRPAPAACAS